MQIRSTPKITCTRCPIRAVALAGSCPSAACRLVLCSQLYHSAFFTIYYSNPSPDQEPQENRGARGVSTWAVGKGGLPLWSSGWDLGSIGLVGGAGLAGGHPNCLSTMPACVSHRLWLPWTQTPRQSAPSSSTNLSK